MTPEEKMTNWDYYNKQIVRELDKKEELNLDNLFSLMYGKEVKINSLFLGTHLFKTFLKWCSEEYEDGVDKWTQKDEIKLRLYELANEDNISKILPIIDLLEESK